MPTSEPCPGGGACCNRSEFDRTIFPCSPASQMAAAVARLVALEKQVASLHARLTAALGRLPTADDVPTWVGVARGDML